MKKIFLLLLIFCLSIYSQTNEFNANSYRSINGEKLEPAWVYIGEAKRAIKNGDTSYALYLMNKTIMYYPDNADAHYYLAVIYEKEAGEPAEQGGAASYRLAIEEYKKAIQLNKNLNVPAYKLDAYFSLLHIYEKLIDEENYAIIEKEIINMAENGMNRLERGRIYFKLAELYDNRNRNSSAIDFYRQSYLNGYRQKLSLFRISIIYRKARNYTQEKEYLILANKYEFANKEPSNYEVQKSIVQRLEALKNVKIPKKLN
jgi:tetratricopeptide (TPR) repeat protein